MSKWYEINNKTGEVYIYDAIDRWEGISAKSFIAELREIKSKDVIIHINSPGGNVFEGFAIYNAIMNDIIDAGKNVTTQIDGLAASISSLIALSGKTVKMSENGMFMIHNPHIFADGDSEALKKKIEILDKIKNQMIEVYVNKTGLKSDEISQMMSNETWLTAKEAKTKGFVDEITNPVKIAAFAEDPGFSNEKYDRFKQQFVNNKEEIQMEELLKALGVQTKAEAIAKINETNTTLTNLQTSVSEMTAKLNEQKINVLIAQGKLLPAKKDFALNLLAKDETLFEDFIKDSERGPSLDSLNVSDNNSGDQSKGDDFEALLEAPEKLEKFKAENPAAYQKLYDKFIENGGA